MEEMPTAKLGCELFLKSSATKLKPLCYLSYWNILCICVRTKNYV